MRFLRWLGLGLGGGDPSGAGAAVSRYLRMTIQFALPEDDSRFALPQDEVHFALLQEESLAFPDRLIPYGNPQITELDVGMLRIGLSRQLRRSVYWPFSNAAPSYENMKYSFTLFLLLIVSWLCWSGHFEPFVLILGALSCLLCIWICIRMRIVDEEGAPVQLGIRPFTRYAPWLFLEIIKSNIEVTRIILSPKMKLQRNLIEVSSGQKTEIGRVILANSITLTPGTVSVSLDKDRILVHALSFEGAEEDLSGDMDERVRRLEGNS